MQPVVKSDVLVRKQRLTFAKDVKTNHENGAKDGSLLAALVVGWGQKHCAVPATSAVEFVNAGRPAHEIQIRLKNTETRLEKQLKKVPPKQSQTHIFTSQTHQLQLVKLIEKGHVVRVYR